MGDRHSCAIDNDDVVHCWGKKNFVAEEQPAGSEFQYKPIPLAGALRAKRIGLKFDRTCLLTLDGHARCLAGPPNAPTSFAKGAAFAPDQVAEIAVGHNHTCVLRTNKSVMCWGSNRNGQLGDGTVDERNDMVTVAGLSDVMHIAAGAHFACALSSAGAVSCWGANHSGQLGQGKEVDPRSRDSDPIIVERPVAVAGLTDATQVAAGSGSACAVRRDGTVSCWGSIVGKGGGLTAVAGLANIVSVHVADNHACARDTQGSLWCWGNAADGATGTGLPLGHNMNQPPQKLTGLTDVIDVAVARDGGCAIVDNGRSARCWGRASGGRLGNGANVAYPNPTQVEAIDNAVQLAVGDYFSCVRHRDGTASCWGGRQGRHERAAQLPATKVAGSAGLQWLGAVGGSAFAVDASGKVTRWPSRPDFLRLGGPVPNAKGTVIGGLGQISDAVGHQVGPRDDQIYVARSDGSISRARWEVDSGAIIQRLSRMRGTDIAASKCSVLGCTTQVCRLGTNKQINCLSYDDEDTIIEPLIGRPGAVVPLKNVTKFAMLANEGCAIHDEGNVSCWRNTDEGIKDVKQVSGLSNVIAIALGGEQGEHHCAVRKTGEVVCWGHHLVTWSIIPLKRVRGISDAVSVDFGAEHICALHRSGKVSCWGDNRFDQIGAKLPPIAFTPVVVGD